MKYARNGGIRFLQIGRVQLSFRIRPKVLRAAPPAPPTSDCHLERIALERSDSFVWPELGV
jgi:hypothetical protein